MAERSARQGQRRRVWRVTANAPFGEIVDADMPSVLPSAAVSEPREGSWLQSSFDLAMGLEVRDATDTITPEAFDALFGH